MTGVRETSEAAYRVVMESGYVGRLQRETYDALYRFGPCTSSELLFQMAGRSNTNNANIRARLNELRERGIAKEVGERPCARTGMTVIVWDVTKDLPTPAPKKKRTRCIWCEGRGYHEHPAQ